MKGAFTELVLWQWVYGVGYSVLAIGVAAFVARRRFERHIVAKGAMS
jgi:hypothetical protein